MARNCKRLRLSTDSSDTNTKEGDLLLCIVCLERFGPDAKLIRCEQNHAACSECFSSYITQTWAKRTVKAGSIPELCCFHLNCSSVAYKTNQIALVANEQAFQVFLDAQQNAKLALKISEYYNDNANTKNIAAEEQSFLLAEQLSLQFPNAKMCPSCLYGPVDFQGCSNLTTYHMRPPSSGSLFAVNKEAPINNACANCGFFSPDLGLWPLWDKVFRNQLFATNNSASSSSSLSTVASSSTSTLSSLNVTDKNAFELETQLIMDLLVECSSDEAANALRAVVAQCVVSNSNANATTTTHWLACAVDMSRVDCAMCYLQNKRVVNSHRVAPQLMPPSSPDPSPYEDASRLCVWNLRPNNAQGNVMTFRNGKLALEFYQSSTYCFSLKFFFDDDCRQVWIDPTQQLRIQLARQHASRTMEAEDDGNHSNQQQVMIPPRFGDWCFHVDTRGRLIVSRFTRDVVMLLESDRILLLHIAPKLHYSELQQKDRMNLNLTQIAIESSSSSSSRAEWPTWFKQIQDHARNVYNNATTRPFTFGAAAHHGYEYFSGCSAHPLVVDLTAAQREELEREFILAQSQPLPDEDDADL